MNDLEKAIAAYRWLVTDEAKALYMGRLLRVSVEFGGSPDSYLAMAKNARPEFMEAFHRGWMSVLSDTEG